MKGLVRYAVSDIVCRCYNSGVGIAMMLVHDTLMSNGCLCNAGYNLNIIMLSGVKVNVCNDCIALIESTVNEYALSTPHCITLHRSHSQVGECVTTISFATGTMMRKVSSHGPWVDTKSGVEFDGE